MVWARRVASVNEMPSDRIIVRTVPAALSPVTVRNGIPATDNAASAMITVAPAKTTAVPAVPAAPARTSLDYLSVLTVSADSNIDVSADTNSVSALTGR